MDPYSKEFRAKVLAACDAQEGTQRIALHFEVSEPWVRRIMQQRREASQVAPKTTRARQPKWHAWKDWLLAKITARPDIYLRELQAELKAERGEEVCLQTICNTCRALERTRKKTRAAKLTGLGDGFSVVWRASRKEVSDGQEGRSSASNVRAGVVNAPPPLSGVWAHDVGRLR